MSRLVDLDDYPFFACSGGDVVRVFINGEDRGYFHPSKNFSLHVIVSTDYLSPDPDNFEDDDDLPF